MKKLIIILVSIICSLQMYGQDNLPKGFKSKVQKEYNEIKKNDTENEMKMDYTNYFSFRKESYLSKQNYYKQISQQKNSSDICSNGTFESGYINTNDWNFYWRGGNHLNSNATVFGNNMINTGAFSSNTAHINQVHHKAVSLGPDPIVGSLLNTVWNIPFGNTTSLRLGNAINDWGLESMAKLITVTPNNASLTFAYAMVLQNPTNPHGSTNVPSFRLNIFDPITNKDYGHLIDLGGGNNVILSNNTSLKKFQGEIMYKPWDCINIDLSSLIGKTVIIEFENRDCNAGGHWAYSYFDNICLGCNGNSEDGSIKLSSKTDSCGLPGKICIDYTIPDGNSPSITLKLELIQNGVTVNILNSPQFNVDDSYCFNLQGSSNGLNTNLAGFDFKITGLPKRGIASLAPRYLGNSAQGIKQGINNDYIFKCPPPPLDFECCESKLDIFNKPGTPNPLNTEQRTENGTTMTIASEEFQINRDATIPITELRVVVTDIQYEYNYESCGKCINNPALWGSIYSTSQIGEKGLYRTSPNYGLTNPNFVYENATVREMIWKNPQGAMLRRGDKFTINYILTTGSEIPCCVTEVKMCTKISWKDANCCENEVLTCSNIKLENGTAGDGNTSNCECGRQIGTGNTVNPRTTGLSGSLNNPMGGKRCGSSVDVRLYKNQWFSKKIHEFRAPAYSCISNDCSLSYKWEIINADGSVHKTGMGQTIHTSFPSRGNFTVRFTPICRGKECAPCDITVKVS